MPVSPFRRLQTYLARHRWGWGLAAGAMLVSTLATSVTASQVRVLLDEALPASLAPATRAAGLQQTAYIVGGMALLTVLGVVLMRQASALIARLAQQLTVEVRADYYAGLMRQAPAFFREHEPGRLIATGLNDTETIGVFMTQAVPFVLVSLGQLGLAVLFMLALNWPLATLCLALVAVLQAWSLRGIVPRMRQLEADYRAGLGRLTGRLSGDLQGVRDIQIFGQEARATQLYRDQLAQLAGTMTRSMDLSVTNFAISYALTGLGLALIYGLGILVGLPGLAGGQVAAGLLASFAALFVQATSPISALSGALLRWQGMLVAAERVFALMDQPSAIQDRPGARDPGRLRGHIRFEGVTFSYAPADPAAWRLNNVNLEILPGQKVAVVGGSGSGKTTLLQLLARFQEPTTGRVTIDGEDVRAYTLAGLRRNLGLVAQGVVLFRGTLRDNLRFGRPDADPAAVMAAAELGNVTEFVDKLEAGYDTELGELGEGLSGGQKQRVSIARAALLDPPILLLDEATSALDNKSEAAVMQAVDRLLHTAPTGQTRTAVIIAHRLNTIRNADKIVLLGTDARGNGFVRAVGTHDQLMETSPEYAELYGRQHRKAILMPLGPLYDTTAALPTVIGLASAYKAPVFLLDFGPLATSEGDDVTDKRFGVSVPLTKESPLYINARHMHRVGEIRRKLTAEGIELTVVAPPRADLDWVEVTLAVIAQTEATHLVAVDNVLVPMEKLRDSIRLIERKGGVEYILVNPIAGLE